MSQAYTERVLDHFQNPRNFGQLDQPDISLEQSNPACAADRIRLDLRFEEGEIVDVRFSGQGCVISLAAASILTERIKGALLADLQDLSRDEFLEMLAISPRASQLKCALLAPEIFREAAYGEPEWPR